jgi:hypothetical protein
MQLGTVLGPRRRTRPRRPCSEKTPLSSSIEFRNKNRLKPSLELSPRLELKPSRLTLGRAKGIFGCPAKKSGALTKARLALTYQERRNPLDGTSLGVTSRVDQKYPTEELSEAEARLRHPGNAVVEFSIVKEDGEPRRAIFVWESEDAMDQEGPIAMYWLT